MSSNSSFNECVRKHYTPPTSIFQNTDDTPKCYISGKDSTNTLCNISIHNTLNDYQICNFEFCTFISVSSSSTNGGAIEFSPTEATSSGTSLTVDHCFFTRCSALNGDTKHSGGGVFAMYISVATVTSCIFHICEGACSGGVFLQHLSYQPLISCCTFISCASAHTGAGAYIGYCGLEVSPIVCADCRFVSCEERYIQGHNLAGGGFSLSTNSNNRANTIVNLLFARNHAISAGGLQVYVKSGITPSVKFCFFYINTATNSAHDINLS